MNQQAMPDQARSTSMSLQEEFNRLSMLAAIATGGSPQSPQTDSPVGNGGQFAASPCAGSQTIYSNHTLNQPVPVDTVSNPVSIPQMRSSPSLPVGNTVTIQPANPIINASSSVNSNNATSLLINRGAVSQNFTISNFGGGAGNTPKTGSLLIGNTSGLGQSLQQIQQHATPQQQEPPQSQNIYTATSASTGIPASPNARLNLQQKVQPRPANIRPRLQMAQPPIRGSRLTQQIQPRMPSPLQPAGGMISPKGVTSSTVSVIGSTPNVISTAPTVPVSIMSAKGSQQRPLTLSDPNIAKLLAQSGVSSGGQAVILPASISGILNPVFTRRGP